MPPKFHAIMGPPGTGKSTHLANLVKELAITEPNMAVVSFTKAAAGVLTSRCPVRSIRFVGTLHALAFRTLGLTRNQVADDNKFADWYGTDIQGVQIAISVYQYSHRTGCDLTEAYATINPILPYMQLEHLVLSYLNWVKEYQYITFDRMIEMATGVVEPFEIVVVDEAQDLTNKQWELVLSMVKPSGQLYVAGDDDQAVYTWCGANPHTMVDMATSREVLRQSYRIPASVHRLADKVVHRINRRAEKEYLPRNVEGSVEYSVFYEPMMYTNKHTVLCRDKWVMKEIEDVLVYHALSYTCNSHTSMYDGGKANLIRAIIAEDFAAIKRMARYLHKQYQEDPYSAVKAGWKKSVDLGRNETEAQYLYLLDHEVEPLVHLSTIHGAKGEEDNHIVLMAHCSGKVEEAMDNAVSYDDELRVWYVGITRAKEKLTVVGYNQYIQ